MLRALTQGGGGGLTSLTVASTPIVGGTPFSVLVEDSAGLLDVVPGFTFGGAAAGTGLAIAAGTATTAVNALNISHTWNNAGVNFIGIYGAFKTTANGGASYLIEIDAGPNGNDTAMLTLSSNGVLTTNSGHTANTGNINCTNGSIILGNAGFIYWNTRSLFASPADGILTISNNNTNDFTRLQFGGTTSSFPALGRSTTFTTVGLADGTGGGGLKGMSNGTASLGAPSVGWSALYLDYTNTATVGSVTINKPSGRVILGAGGTSLTLTNSLITAASRIFVSADSAPGNIVAVQFYAVPGVGSCTINAVPAVTNQTNIDFLVINAD